MVSQSSKDSMIVLQEESRPEAAAHLTFPALCLIAALILLLSVICWTSQRYLSSSYNSIWCLSPADASNRMLQTLSTTQTLVEERNKASSNGGNLSTFEFLATGLMSCLSNIFNIQVPPHPCWKTAKPASRYPGNLRPKPQAKARTKSVS